MHGWEKRMYWSAKPNQTLEMKLTVKFAILLQIITNEVWLALILQIPEFFNKEIDYFFAAYIIVAV